MFVITANGDVCNNAVIKCSKYTNYAYCQIYQNNVETISQAISFCSAGSLAEFRIYFGSELQDTTTTITLNLANNIQRIYIDNWHSIDQPVNLISTQTHPNISSVYLKYLSIHNSENILEKFPNITYILVESCYFETFPKFSTFEKLTYLYISCSSRSRINITMDKEWVGGLSKLKYLGFNYCGIQNITTDAFLNLNSLTYLDLSGNEILELTSDVFRYLTELSSLILFGNKYDISLNSNNHNTFTSLKKLTYLDFSYTTIIPFDAFSVLKQLKSLDLPMISSGIIPSTPFQHLHSLTYISFSGISLICNCSMQWASIIGKFGISFSASRCSDSGHYIHDSNQYTECGLTGSYQCFNKTVACKNTCINTPDSYICACDAGYGLSLTEAETVCHDIDECMLNTSQCEQKCRNTLGSYQCYCDSGYKLSDDLISCTDINECSKSSWNKCEQHKCMNEVGSYSCTCDTGYQLAGDGYSCHDLDECSNASLNTCNQHTCINVLGTYTCICKQGYQLTINTKTCEDINECSLVTLNSCELHKCMNDPGSYRCACNEGFQLAENNISCHDIDECLIGINNCNKHKCLNLVGSYTCSCGEGYIITTNPITCEDIDECIQVESNSCSDHQCVNEQGFYRCVCDDGYELAVNNISCHDTDECMNANNSCNPHVCLNIVGSYKCTCGVGYKLNTNSTNCLDIDECSLISNSCGNHQCVNEQGFYRCACDEGYQLSVNNISCHDTDECMNANNSCNPHKCLNLVGSYTCSCGEGYQLTKNGMSCEDIDECSQVELKNCEPHNCQNEPGFYRCVCKEGFKLSVNNISCHDIDECTDTDNSCNQNTCINLVGSYMCKSGDSYQPTTGRKKEDMQPTNVLYLPISDQSNAQDVYIGFIVFLIIIIVTLILCILALLSIIIYMYNKKPNTKVQFQELSDKQPEKTEYTEVAPDLSLPDQISKQNYS